MIQKFSNAINSVKTASKVCENNDNNILDKLMQ